MRKLGISPEQLDPTRYAGPKFNVIPCTEARRRPAVTDRDYSLLSLWRVAQLPVDGSSEGEVWQLLRFESNGDATWRRIDYTGAGAGIDTLTVDSVTAPGVNPVEPNGVGNVNVLGDAVANHSVPVETRTHALNNFTIEVQIGVARTGAPANKLDAGLSSYDDAIFTQDTNGYVSMVGGAVPPAQKFTVDRASGGAPNPIVPSAVGVLTVSGNVVAAHNVAVETHTSAANSFGIDIQVAKTISAAPGSKIDTGLSVYDAAHFNVDTDGYTQLKTPPTSEAPGASNLGISYDGGTGAFTVLSSDGTDLSATNPSYVRIGDPSTPGEQVVIKVTSNATFDDDVGSGDLDGNLFGHTTGDVWGQDIPFFLYAIINDSGDTIQFAISKDPRAKYTPAAASMGQIGAATADAYNAFWVINSGLTFGDYDGNPCVLLGCFRMQLNQTGGTDRWTVQALEDIDGIGRFFQGVRFTVPTGTQGADASTYFIDRSGSDTVPTFASGGLTYQIGLDGRCEAKLDLTSNNNAASGTGQVTFIAPYPLGISQNVWIETRFVDDSGGTLTLYYAESWGGEAYADTLTATDGGSTASPLTYADIDTNDSLQAKWIFNAFGEST